MLLLIPYANSYTFYVETSEYSETVSVIEDVVKTNKNFNGLSQFNETETVYIGKINSSNQIPNQIPNEKNISRILNNNYCSNINIKNKELLTQNYENKLLQNGLSKDSISLAKEFWNNHGTRGAKDRCGKLSSKLILERAILLNNLVMNTNYKQFHDKSKYPKIEYLELSNKDNKFSKNEEYLKAISKEISELRNDLFKQSKGKVVIDYYFQNIFIKGKNFNSSELSSKESKYFAEYFAQKINSQIREGENIDVHIYNFNMNNTMPIENNKFSEFIADVAPILEFYSATMNTKEKENFFLNPKPSKLNSKKPSILFELAASFNKL